MAYVMSHWWERRLPHIEKIDRTYFVTFATVDRHVLTPNDRDIALETLLEGHEMSYALYAAVVMPDHLHFIATLYAEMTLPLMIKFVKSVSARRMGGPTWQREYFDRIVRNDEYLREKAEYIVSNPVQAGLVDDVEKYPWIWRSWVEGRRR